MAKLTLTDLASLTNDPSATTTINNNNTAIETALENTLSRDGTTPNTMSADLDINTHHILNLAQATTAGHAVEYTQLQDRVDEMNTIRDEAEGFKNQAAGYAAATANDAEATAADVVSVNNILNEIILISDAFHNSYLGTFNSDPTVDNDGNPLTVGDIYYNSVLLSMRVWDGTVWQDVAAMTPTSNNEISNKIYINPVFRGTFLPETDDGVALGSTSKRFSDLFLASGAVINFNSSDVTITHNAASGGRLDFAGGSDGYYFSSTIAPSANDGAPLGSASVSWSDLFLASGAVINFNNSNVLLTHTANSLALTGVGTNGFSIDGALKVLGGYGTTNGSGNLAIGSTNTGTNNISIAWGDNSGKTLNLGYAAAGVFTPRYKFVDTGAFSPAVNDSAVLGTSALMWSDLFLASGAVINFNNGDYTLTHSSGVLTASGTLAATQLQADSNFYSTVISSNPIISFDSTDSITYGRSVNTWYFNIGGSTPIYVNGTTIGPGANDLTSLGTSGTAFSDLFLATGAVVGFGAGNYTLTHSTGILTASGDIRISSVGTNSASVVTIGGTQTLTNKTLTSPVISTPVISTIVNTGTLTLPTATSTILSNTGNVNLTGGFTATSYNDGTVSSGTLTPAAANGNFHHYTNNGAHTLAPPSAVCTMVIENTNGASAGIITTSSFTKVTGDTLNTTNANKFIFFITKTNSYSHLHVQALQ